ncbi:MAG: MBL fold metallo-hydrolase [Alphaproteobacteria bacterium]
MSGRLKTAASAGLAGVLCAVSIVLGASPAVSQPVNAPPTGGRTQVVLLGTAGGPPLRLHRSEPSNLLIVDGRLYLFDCGLGAVRQIMAAGLRPEAVNTVFITHHHPDHDLDLVGLMGNTSFMADATASKPMRIFGPPGTVAMTKAAIDYLGVPFGQFAAEHLRAPWPPQGLFDATDLAKEGLVFQDDKIRVYAAENSHFSLMTPAERAGRYAYSYRVETPDAVVVFTGDTGPSAAVAKLAMGADVLVTEAIDVATMERNIRAQAAAGLISPTFVANNLDNILGHMRDEHLDLPEVAKLANAAQVRSVIVTHMGPESDTNRDLGTYAARIQSGFRGQIEQAVDLARFCVVPKTSGSQALKACPIAAPSH